MSNLIPLPGPLCSATVPSGGYCSHDSTATVKVEAPTGLSLLAWRCREHIPAMVDATVWSCRDATITITPLTAAESSPAPDPEAIQPLHLVSG
jgi:hypothetical protein